MVQEVCWAQSPPDRVQTGILTQARESAFNSTQGLCCGWPVRSASTAVTVTLWSPMGHSSVAAAIAVLGSANQAGDAGRESLSSWLKM